MSRAAAILMLLAMPAYAGWQFSPEIEVGATEGRKIFHHLESANRKGLAESAGRIALVWEDNREGDPHCWLAIREAGATAFLPPRRITDGECYEPVVQGVGDGSFIMAWEEDGAVWARSSDKGTPLKLSAQEAAHVTLASKDGQRLYAAWAERAGKFNRIMLAHLKIGSGELGIERVVPLEEQLPEDEQSYPALAVNADGGLTVLWEDRRKKHTMILAAHSTDGSKFDVPYRVIDIPRVRTINLGAGMGSMRPTVSSCGRDCLAAAWMDKRDFLSGYDVYADISLNGGRSFTKNTKAHDIFGDNVAQWHGAIAANQSGRVVAVWDDDRDGTPDVWLSDWTGNGFGDDLAVPGASGPGAQSDPVVYLDAKGKLHLAWIEKTESGDTRLKYASAVWKE